MTDHVIAQVGGPRLGNQWCLQAFTYINNMLSALFKSRSSPPAGTTHGPVQTPLRKTLSQTVMPAWHDAIALWLHIPSTPGTKPLLRALVVIYQTT